jgi:Domain of unknown function (DUF4157)
MEKLTLSEQFAQNSLRQQPFSDPAASSGSSSFQRREGGHYDDSPRLVTQRQSHHRLRGGLRQTIQRQHLDTLQRSSAGSGATKPASSGGLPDALRTNMEALSGVALGDVRVHHHSSLPAQMQAQAYAQGHDIHLAAGQEKHLPHEAWHVVQQKQGRVKAKAQMSGIDVNDDPSLEREADVMGGKALRYQNPRGALASKIVSKPSLQRVKIKGAEYENDEIWREVRAELLQQSIPEKYLDKLKIIFDSLPEKEEFDYFDEIAGRLVRQYNEENNGSLEFTPPDEVKKDKPATGLSGALSKLLAVLPWLLLALIVFQLLIPVVGATPLSSRRGRQTEDGELDALEPLPDISPEDQLALTPITHFKGLEQPPPLALHGLVDHFHVPRGGTRIDEGPGRGQVRFHAPEPLPETFPENQLALTPIPRVMEAESAPAFALHSLVDSFHSPRGGTRTDEGPGRKYESEEGMSLRDYVIWNIFSSRRNFGELPKVPRQDMTLADWLVNGPSWLYLPYTKFSPTELAVFVKHFHIKPALAQIPKTLMKSTTGTMHAVVNRVGPEPSNLAWTFFKKAVLRGGYETLNAYYRLFIKMQDLNAQARSFRSDLSADPWIKNSYRHAYWMCQFARNFGAAFASDLGYAHEYAHLDLTIEGPFDSVLDKINNLWGIKLAEKMDQTCDELVNDVGERGYLAWAKQYEKSQESGIYLPTLHNVQGPLDELWERYQELPKFNEYDLNVMSLLKMQLPGQKKSSVVIEEID